MSKIEINCVDQVLTFMNMPVIASGDINADRVSFTFCPLWEGFSKVCVFYQNPGSRYYGMIDDAGEVLIPAGVISNPGIVYIGVSGYKDGVTKTSNVIAYDILEGAYTEADPDEGKSFVEVFREILEQVENIPYLYTTGENEFEYSDDVTTEILSKQEEILGDYSEIMDRGFNSLLTMKTGEYTGTGESGESHPTKLSIPIGNAGALLPIKILYVFRADSNSNNIVRFVYGQSRVNTPAHSSSHTLKVTWNADGSVEWYADGTSDDAANQLNGLQIKYRYFAIGSEA